MASYEDAQDCFITVNGIKFAYRRFGLRHGTPLLLVPGYRRTMDHWDPALVNPLAAKRPVILIDNAGVGRSAGLVPKTFAGWTQHYLTVLKALSIIRVDVLGYSMGGCVSQLIALTAPALVRRLILCGTTPSTGEGVTRAPVGPFNSIKEARTSEEHERAFLSAFFTTSAKSQAAGAAAWKRLVKARKDCCDYVDPDNSRRQGIAFVQFMDPKQAADASYDRFSELKIPVLIANGNEDLLLPTENSILMWKMLSKQNAQLHLYPDSGHGFLYQYADEFSTLINDFLDQQDNMKVASRL